MTAELLARLGGFAAGGGLALLIVTVAPRLRLLGLALWATGMGLCVPVLVPEGELAFVAAGGVGLVLLAGGLAVLFRRLPWALPFLALAAVPARIPVTLGDESATLLLPLYVVIAGAGIALAWSLWREEGEARELGLLTWPVALFMLWLGASALWAGDPKEAAIDLFFFVLPFAVLALAIARLPWREAELGWLLRLLAGMALLFAAVGIWQWGTKEIFWNAKVMRSNENNEFFRVNSLFWDPSIYGRFLVLAIVAILVVLLDARRRSARFAVVAGAVLVLWIGLFLSFSQSSFVALLAALAAVALLAWGWRSALALGIVVVAATAVVLFAPQLDQVRSKFASPSSESVNRATRGRFDLVSKGVRIAADHPLVGVGIGNFPAAYEQRFDPGRLGVPASHTTPVTIVAETGVVGLALFLALVVAALVLAFRCRGADASATRLTGLVAGFAILAIAVHSLFYSAFLEDPTAWGLLGLAALAAARARRPERHDPSVQMGPGTLTA